MLLLRRISRRTASGASCTIRTRRAGRPSSIARRHLTSVRTLKGFCSIDSYNVVRTFPALFLRPVKGENNLAPNRELVSGQVGDEDS